MTQTTEPPAIEVAVAPQPVEAPAKKKPKVRRRPARRFMIVSHRWISLVLGLVLLVISTSGAVLLYRPELAHLMNKDAYSPSGGPQTVSFSQAFDTVKAAHPDFEPTGVVAESGIYKVTNADYEDFWSVDPSTGQILGHIGKKPTWIAWTDNLHECFLTCEESPGFWTVLAKEVPGTSWLSYEEDTDLTYGTLVLGTFGLLLLYLSLTGLWLWFPRPSQWKKSMNVRWKRGRFARDTDLHKVAGMIAIPALLMWAITGSGFELKPVEKAWYAVTPGSQLPEAEDPVSVEAKTPPITTDQAVAAAHQAFPEDKVVSVDVPVPDDPTSGYNLWLGAGFDPYGQMEYPGDRGVFVDQYSGAVTVTYADPEESAAQSFWDSWNYPLHSGYIVNGWWRLVWLVLGLSPLLLAITGVSTWLVRRRTKKNRRKAAAAA